MNRLALDYLDLALRAEAENEELRRLMSALIVGIARNRTGSRTRGENWSSGSLTRGQRDPLRPLRALSALWNALPGL